MTDAELSERVALALGQLAEEVDGQRWWSGPGCGQHYALHPFDFDSPEQIQAMLERFAESGAEVHIIPCVGGASVTIEAAGVESVDAYEPTWARALSGAFLSFLAAKEQSDA